MGITASKTNNELIVENFDGQAGDHDVDPGDIQHEFGPEWFLDSEQKKLILHQMEELDNTPESVPRFSFNGQLVAGKCVKVYDGDTCHFVVRYNDQWIRRRFRMIGYNSPEIRGTCAEEKERAIAARDYLANRLLGKKVVLYLHDFDKWGRVLCDVYLPTGDDLLHCHLNEEMIEQGHGVPYQGHN